MQNDLISRSRLHKALQREESIIVKGLPYVRTDAVLAKVSMAPSVDAIHIDVVAKMLENLMGDSVPCNYNNIDEMLSLDCGRDGCPDDGDHCCWKRYIKAWLELENKRGGCDV